MKRWSTVQDFIASGKAPASETVAAFEGFASKGDGGASFWVKTGSTGVPSQSPTDLNAAVLTDSQGAYWRPTSGAIFYFDGTNQWFPAPFGGEGAGLYQFDGVGWNYYEQAGGAVSIAVTTGLITNEFNYDVGTALTFAGYSTPGDGGGAQWLKTATVDTPSQSPAVRGDGTLTDALGYVWEVSTPIVSALAFGVRNGFDSTAELQAAVNSGTKKVLLDEIDCIIDSVKITNSIEISGSGKLTHLQSATGPLFDVTQSGVSVSINGIELDGNRTSQPAEFQGALLRLSSFSSRTSNVTLKVSGVSFKNMSGFGCLLYGDFTSESGHDVSIKDCLFDGINEGNSSSYNPCQIFAADGIETLSVTGNVFKSGYDFSTFGACAFQLTSTNPASRATSNVTFSDNTSYGMGRSAANGLGALDVYVWGENLIITDNRMVDSFSPGLRAKASSENVIISNNHVINTQNNYEAISFANTTTGVCYGSLTVTGNVVDGANNGIFIEGATTDSFEEVTCNSNVVKNVTNDGINLNNIENFTVNGNVVKSTGRYGIFIKTWWGTANVSNNSIDTTGNIGIYSTWLNINYGESMVISGNAIKNPTTRGIQVVYSSALNISDNVINATSVGDGIRIDDVQDAYVVADNIVLGVTTPFAALNSAGAIAKVNNNSWQ